jgi:hypothetical protein
VFILPFIAFILTSYSIYLKEKMNNLEVGINDLKTSTEENLKDNSLKNDEISIELPELNIKPNTANIKLEELNYYSLLQRSTNTLFQNNKGAVRIFENQQKLLEAAVDAYENDIIYYIFINNDKYYLYREDYVSEEEQKMYAIQLYLYFEQAPAYLPANTLRKSGLPVYILNSYTQSNNEYFAIMTGLFEEYSEALEYLENMDEERFRNLTGLSIKDRFLKSISFYSIEN